MHEFDTVLARDAQRFDISLVNYPERIQCHGMAPSVT